MISRRDLISFFVGVCVAAALLTLVIYRTNTVQHHVCEGNLKVRTPLEDYISTTIPLYRLSAKIQAAEAKLQPPPPQAIAKLQAQMLQLQRQNFQNLLNLNDALHRAVVTGCSE